MSDVTAGQGKCYRAALIGTTAYTVTGYRSLRYQPPLVILLFRFTTVLLSAKILLYVLSGFFNIRKLQSLVYM